MGSIWIIIIYDFYFSPRFLKLLIIKLENELLRYSCYSNQLYYTHVGNERFNFWSFAPLSPIKNFRQLRGNDIMQVFIWQEQLAVSKVYWRVWWLSVNYKNIYSTIWLNTALFVWGRREVRKIKSVKHHLCIANLLRDLWSQFYHPIFHPSLGPLRSVLT